MVMKKTTWLNIDKKSFYLYRLVLKDILVFSENSSWTKHFGLQEREKLLVLFTHDESIFNANNGKKKI